jgi:polyisoprenoid-binding protein YceI
MGSLWDGVCSLPDIMNLTRLRILPTFLRPTSALVALVLGSITSAAAQNVTLQLDPAHTTVKITLGAALHTVHGTFQLKSGALQLDTASGQVSGAIIVDAKSGETGNGSRDRKMHKDVLESERYTEIVFRPDRVEGTVAAQGKSSVKVHGIFGVHGTDHEITVPAEVNIGADHWSAHAHFTIPYEKWGIKNPSNLFLHVSDSVEIDIAAEGSVTKALKSAANGGQ